MLGVIIVVFVAVMVVMIPMPIAFPHDDEISCSQY